MRAKTKKWFSPLFVLTLAVAGIFGVSAAVVDKQVEETPAVEKADAESSSSDSDSQLLLRILAEASNGSGKYANANARTRFTIQGDGGDYDSTTSSWLTTAASNNWNSISLNGTTSYWYQEITVYNRNWLNAHDVTVKRSDPSSMAQWNYCNTGHTSGSATYNLCTYGGNSSNSLLCTNPSGSTFSVSNKGFIYKIRLMCKSTIGGDYEQYTCVVYDSTHTYTFPTSSITSPTGYDFAGWYTTSACTVSAGTSLKPTEDTILYAKYTPSQYTINYRDQGDVAFSGTHASGYPTKHTYGTSTTLKTASKTGYTFGGWFTNSACTGSATTTLGATAYTSAPKLFAKWTAHTYTIAFDKNAAGATGSTASVTGVTYNASGKSLTSNGFSYAGHIFMGWSTTTSGDVEYSNGKSLAAADTIDLYPGSSGGTRTLYAVWEEITTYNVSFAVSPAGYGTLSTTSIANVPEGTTYSLSGDNFVLTDIDTIVPTPTSATEEWTYVFTGWSSSSGSISDSNKSFTANFDRVKNTYTITWKNGNNSTIETDNNVEYGTTPTYDGSTPTKTATAQYTYTWDGGWSPAVTTVTGNQTYVATFNSTVNKYTITWENDDGTVLETDTNIPYGSTPSYDGSTPRKSPTATKIYTFNGWSPTVTTVTGNTTYTATYSEESVDPSAAGWFGGETYFFVDKINGWGSVSDDARLRIVLYDDNDVTVCFTADYTTDYVYKTSGTWNTYRIIMPDYTGSSNKGWTKIKFTRYNPAYDSDTTVNWTNTHCWTQSIDYTSGNLKDYSEWWAYEWNGGPYGDNILMSGAQNNGLYGITSGETCYFEFQSSWGKTVSTNLMAIHFWGAIGDGNSSYTADVVFLDSMKVLGTGSDYSDGLWEFTVPYANNAGSDKLVTWHSYEVVELKDGCTTIGNNYENVQKQGGSKSFSSSDNYNPEKHNVIKSSGVIDHRLFDAGRLGYFVTYFNTTIGGTCIPQGGTNISTLNTAWTNVAGQLPIEDRIANQFKTSDADPGQGATNIEQAAARYDYVLKKYEEYLTAGDFAHRKQGGNYTYPVSSINSFSPYELIIGSDDNTSIILIIIASSISILSITALSVLMVKKKKSANK